MSDGVCISPRCRFMPPDDPLGRHGPTLENFLRRVPKTQKKQPCPYGERAFLRHVAPSGVTVQQTWIPNTQSGLKREILMVSALTDFRIQY